MYSRSLARYKTTTDSFIFSWLNAEHTYTIADEVHTIIQIKDA